MKKIRQLLVVLFFLILTKVTAQEKINYQQIVRNNSGDLVTNTQLGIQISILESSTGAAVYTEQQTLSSNYNGLITIVIGNGTIVSGNLSMIDWSSGDIHVKTEIDITGATAYTITSIKPFLYVPYALSSNRTAYSNELNYNSLTNLPTVITTEQSNKIDNVDVTLSTDLEQYKSNISLNTAKNSFPGFGVTSGTAFEILWKKINNDVYYDTGNVGIGFNNATDFTRAPLNINGGLLQNGEPSVITPGMLYYDPAGSGFFFYYNNMGELKPFGNRNVNFITRNNIFVTDVTTHSALGVGEAITPGYEFNDNDLALVDNEPRIFFFDTSVTSAFPRSDWLLEANDIQDGGENYFAISEVLAPTNRTPFKVMAGATTNSIFINENGNMGVNMNTPEEKLDINGEITSSSFTGDGSKLTGVNTIGTTSVINTGSTTIGADTDVDLNGMIDFQVSNLNRMMVLNNGNVGMGVVNPSQLLEATGTSEFDSMQIEENLQLNSSVSTSIFEDPTNGATTLNYDVAGKSVIIFNSTTGVITIGGILNAETGQEITFINKGTSTLNFPFNVMNLPGTYFPTLQLNQYSSITAIFDGGQWRVIDIIN